MPQTDCYFTIPTCVDKQPLGGVGRKYTSGEHQTDTSEIGWEVLCMFFAGTGVLGRRKEESRQKEENEEV